MLICTQEREAHLAANWFTNGPSVTVPHDFIAKLARDIREKDQRYLVERERQIHVSKIISEGGYILWKGLNARLKQYVDMLRADLGDNPLLNGDLRFSSQPNRIVITKREFPYVSFVLTLNLNMQSATASLSKGNPRADGNNVATSIKIDFKVGELDRVYATMSGMAYDDADSLAKALMETIFSV